jgi:CheY-like chemotaxis protein
MDHIRVLIADDHPLFREGMHGLLDSLAETEVVGEATTGAEAITQAKALQPDVILMDIKMPGINGIEATRAIVAASPHISILMVTMLEDDESVFAAMRAGARLCSKRREPGRDPASDPRRGQRRGHLWSWHCQTRPRLLRSLQADHPTAGVSRTQRAGEGTAGAGSAGPQQSGDRRSVESHPQDGTQPCLQHLQQAASGGPGAGGPAGTGSRIRAMRRWNGWEQEEESYLALVRTH